MARTAASCLFFVLGLSAVLPTLSDVSTVDSKPGDGPRATSSRAVKAASAPAAYTHLEKSTESPASESVSSMSSSISSSYFFSSSSLPQFSSKTVSSPPPKLSKTRRKTTAATESSSPPTPSSSSSTPLSQSSSMRTPLSSKSPKLQPKTSTTPKITNTTTTPVPTVDIEDTFPTDSEESSSPSTRKTPGLFNQSTPPTLKTPTTPRDPTSDRTHPTRRTSSKTTLAIPPPTKPSKPKTPPTPTIPSKPQTTPSISQPPTPYKPTTPPKPPTPPVPQTPKWPKEPPTPPPLPTRRTAKTTTTTTTTTTATTTVAPPLDRFCNLTRNQEYETSCIDCTIFGRNEPYICNPGEHRAFDYHGRCDLPSAHRRSRRRRRGYWTFGLASRRVPRRRSRRGCNARCLRRVQIPRCCQGFWGVNCDECPGGARNPCNGNGRCTVDGSCICYRGFNGTACELCEDRSRYGPRCSQECDCQHGDCVNYVHDGGACRCHSGYKGKRCDQVIEGCLELNCQSPGVCAETNQGATCICPPGYDLNEKEGICIPVNPCLGQFPLCGKANTECKHIGPDQYTCVCAENYTGDGIVCIPIDPCQTNRGGCPEDRDCLHTGPNKSDCVCMSGYEAKAKDAECTLQDVCRSDTCHPNATCETTGPRAFTCTCNDGYVGDGTQCYGNIIERLIELNSTHRSLRGDLEYAIHYLTKYYLEELTQHGPFTIFVPTDRAFRAVKRRSGGFARFIENKDRALQIMRQHMLIGSFSLEDLQNYDRFYTLQGNPALLQVKVAKDVFKYKLDGTKGKGKIKVRNLLASNGMIHIVNNLLTTEPEIEGDPEGTALDLMKQTTRHYRTMVSLIQAAKLEGFFSQMNTTVFGVADDVWNSLPRGTIEYLKEDPDGKEKLSNMLLHHIGRGAVGITHLINMDTISSFCNAASWISVNELGRVQLDKQTNITQANIVVKTGFVHQVDGLMVPKFLGVLYPNVCHRTVLDDVTGRCMPCDLRKCPRPTDIMTRAYSRRCRLGTGFHCRALCKRKREVRECCSGFYGPSCLPCPSGFRSPCSGRGQCDDGIQGRGRCQCDDAFSGTACQMCRDNFTFGPSCNQTCTCLHGICNNGPEGDGLCLKNTCLPGFISENCDRQMMKCGPRTLTCHAHSTCYVGEDKIYRCKCNRGYEGDGEDCIEMDPCEQKFNGGCHQQAKCIKLSPLTLRCECNQGWTGDGSYCLPRSPCYQGCHENALCMDVNSEMHCVCDVGFSGNGTWCKVDNVCLENNGGCHPKALCTPLKPGLASGERRTCECPPDMSGNGTVCHGTIAEQVMAHPNLTKLAAVMAKVPFEDILLSQEDDDYTFFAPSDEAMDEFLSRFAGPAVGTEYEVLQFLNFHSLYSAHSLQDLALYNEILKGFKTLYDGFSLYTVNSNNKIEDLKIVVNHSKFASFVTTNILTTNGLIHIIDQVLEPFLPDANKPTVETALQNNSDYSTFYNLLEETGVLEQLREMDKFTVFVPTNSAFGPINQRLSADALRYYVIPSLVFTPSVYNKQRLNTLLGPLHQLQLSLSDESVFVNGEKLTKPDVLIDGGVIHEIGSLLHPILNWCNVTGMIVTEGMCVDCNKNVSDLPCPDGFAPFVPARVRHYHCSYTTDESVIGCQQICAMTPTNQTCCSGFFGSHCQECPGGAERPCSGQGSCFDGYSGNGTCSCDPGFSEFDCSQCEDSSMGLPHCNATHSSCETEVSGCHENAVCTANMEGPAQCTCMAGYHGDGEACTINVNPCELKHYGGCDPGRASCKYEPPLVTDLQDSVHVCQCLDGYKGNGTLCSLDMLDLVSRLPELSYFRSKLAQTELINMTALMEGSTQKITLFAPQSENYVSLTFPDLVIKGESLWLPKDTDDVTAFPSATQKNLLKVATALGGQQINVTVDASGQLFANNVPILEKNIETQNGVLHITATPISAYEEIKASTAHSRGGSNSTIIAVCVVTIIIVIIIVVVVALLFVKSKKSGGLKKIFNRSRSTEGSDTSVSFARLSAQEEDDELYRSSVSDPAKYDNPIFNDPDLM